jgi:DNA-binding helix-hairpin-helix protein with protein kinase domain
MTELQTGDTVRMQAAGESLLIGQRIAEGGQGVVYQAELNGEIFAVKWYRLAAGDRMGELLKANLNGLVKSGRPQHSAFVWPIDMVSSPGRDGFGYVMPLLQSSFTSFVQMLKADIPPGFRALTQIGINLVDAFASLHTSGLCYRDISFGNLYVNPRTADVAVIDNDNVGPSGGCGVVMGTPQFMAPEVIREEVLPSTETDLYSLAVFLFYLFCFGHPLEGTAVEASYSWEDGRRLSEQELMMKHFGRNPVFVFDPDNAGNRPVADSPVLSWWDIYPGFFQKLFVRSFTSGLHDASLTGRLTEGVWRRGLYRLADCVWQCGSCQAAIFYDPDNPGHPCWGCGLVPPPPAVLTVPGHTVVLADGAVLTGRHLRQPRAARQVLAAAETDPRYPGAVMLRNLTDRVWTVEPAGEEKKQVKPRQRLLVRPMIMELAGIRAEIRHASGGKDGFQ